MKKLLLCVFAGTLILLFPQAAANGARNAMAVWYKTVAPALFPFMVLMPVLTGSEACTVYRKLFSAVMKKLFSLQGAAAPAVLICMVAGSPGGAVAIRQLATSGALRQQDVRRLGFAMCGLSPAYLILGIGQGLYGSIAMGWKLAAVQAGIQLMLLFLSRYAPTGDGEIGAGEIPKVSWGMSTTVESMLSVCGYMVFSGAIGGVLADLLGRRIGGLLLLAADLPGGSALLAESHAGEKMILQCAALGFCGLCIAFQNMDILKKIGVSWKTYLCGRMMAMLIFAGAGCFLVDGAVHRLVIRGTQGKIYAFSLFFAILICIPAMFFLCRNLFLNNRKSGNICGQTRKNHNI